MLNIIKSKLKRNYIKEKNLNKNEFITPKKLGLIVRNWKNSIYVYNKNTLKLIPEASRLTNKLINYYFNLYNLKKEIKISKIKRYLLKKSRYIKKKIITKNKIFISSGIYKHTNDLVNITIYFYNRQLLNYNNLIWKKYMGLMKKKKLKLKLKNRLLKVRKISLRLLKKHNKQKEIVIKALNIKNIKNLNSIKYFQTKNYKKFLKKSFTLILIYIYYKQLIYINKFKFNNYYLQNLVNIVKKIYKKNIQFNFINVRYFNLNSDILTESLVLKLKKNRKKLLKYLYLILRKTKKTTITELIDPNINDFKNLNLNNFYLDSNKKDIDIDTTNNILYNNLLKNLKDKKIKYAILEKINYKKIRGIKLEASGRLTKRNTASRSISKLKYKGSLKNYHSSFSGRSSSLLRGNFRPNLEYTKLNSKTQIGSFGIKGWISGI
uniref:Small ribosomal subunit protein uS3m n=1 Tax=Nannizziopsis barbatae TaxID=1007502 RepID=A0AA51QUG5_9EURO|nr:ribosomal protein S5 [Nannizziopsis barbatae]WML69458.1 ribosomal protein S5 [Nannizziopsis barbatae]